FGGLAAGRPAVARLDRELKAAKWLGAGVRRRVCLSGRRYETFATTEQFRRFARQARESLWLAEPVAARHGVRLAVENHKDWRIDELVALVKELKSEHVGVCVDTGNSIALLEDPLAEGQADPPL